MKTRTRVRDGAGRPFLVAALLFALVVGGLEVWALSAAVASAVLASGASGRDPPVRLCR